MKALSRYKFTKKLHSTSVNLELLMQLENYILDHLFKLLEIENREIIKIEKIKKTFKEIIDEEIKNIVQKEDSTSEDIENLVDKIRRNNIDNFIAFNRSLEKYNEKYKFLIEDYLGEEEFNRVADFNRSKFDNNTKRVRLDYSILDYERGSHLNISISFDKSKLFSEISISMTSVGAKELASGIESSISSIIKNYRNSNYLFAERVNVDFIVMILNIFLPILALLIFKYYPVESIIIFAFVLSLNLYKKYMRRYKPYCEFDTREQEEFNDKAKWFNRLIIGFLITGVAFVFLRKYLLNF
ncbi:MAG: hypothetical protein AB8G22_18890 [Saprospiraceae bacterium]